MCVLHISNLLWDVNAEHRNFSRGWLDYYRLGVGGGGSSLSFLNWVNLVSGPLGGRKPNGLIREEGLMIGTSSSGRGVQAGTSMAWCLMLQPLTAPRTCTSPRRPLEHIFGSLGRSRSLTISREEFTEEIHKKMKCIDLQWVWPYVLLSNRQFPHVFFAIFFLSVVLAFEQHESAIKVAPCWLAAGQDN